MPLGLIFSDIERSNSRSNFVTFYLERSLVRPNFTSHVTVDIPFKDPSSTIKAAQLKTASMADGPWQSTPLTTI